MFLLGVTVGRMLAMTSARLPDKEMLVARCHNARSTFRDLDRLATEVAAVFTDSNLYPLRTGIIADAPCLVELRKRIMGQERVKAKDAEDA